MTRVRELREAKGIQQKELAIDLNVSQPTISDWESGRKVPSAKSTQKLADYFGVTIDYLLGRTDQKEKLPTESEELSSAELELVNAYRDAPANVQAAIRTLLEQK